jgi:hypothetical protein
MTEQAEAGKNALALFTTFLDREPPEVTEAILEDADLRLVAGYLAALVAESIAVSEHGREWLHRLGLAIARSEEG